MDTSISTSDKQQEFLAKIVAFVDGAKGLEGLKSDTGRFRIEQAVDGKFIEILTGELEDVLFRSDTEGQEFIQVNFCSGTKILITTSLIGFKPVALKGLDLAKLPRVVTTPDIMSVIEAIQDAMESLDHDDEELKVLRKVYEAVVQGGEAVGFDLSRERAWITRLSPGISRLVS